MPDLFPIPETLSPRLEPWAAWAGPLETAIEKDSFATGQTEDDAITNLAKALNIPLWNEEGYKK